METTTNQNNSDLSIAQSDEKIKNSERKAEIVYIPIEKLHPHDANPRKDVGDVSELAESIKANGILQNLTVVPATGYWHGDYIVIIGHRRLAGAKKAGLSEVPCIVREMTEKEQIATMLLENMQRSDLTTYEQAQGFQMMIDFGETQESIAEKTGFSKTTVGRRLKLLNINKEKFQAAESRGGTLDDYIKVAEIKNAKVRDKVTDAIGTSNFQWELRKALEEQQIKEVLPAVKKEMKKLGATKDDSVRSWSEGYEQVHCVKVSEYTENSFADKVKKGTEYWWNIQYGTDICLYKKKPKTKEKPVKKTQKELDAIERRKKLKVVTQKAYECRRDFLSEFSASKKDAEIINEWLWDLMYDALSGDSHSRNWDLLTEKIGEENEKYKYSCKKENLMKYVEKAPRNAQIVVVAALSGDSKNTGYYSEGYGEQMPTHRANETLDKIYEYLCKLGYEMSDEEKALRDGTHELYKPSEEDAELDDGVDETDDIDDENEQESDAE